MTGRVVYQDRGFAPRLDHTEPYLVDYALLTQIGNEFYALEHIRRHHRALFFEKALDWRDENEFRWVVADGGAASICLEFEDALVGIAFGETCPEDSIRACVRLARRVGIDFEQLKWKNSAPWLSLRTDWALM